MRIVLSFLLVAVALKMAAAPVRPDAHSEMAPVASALTGDESVEELVRQLGDESYPLRERASHALLRRGPVIEAELRRLLGEARDPEIRRRLADVLDNIVPPQRAALLLRVEPESTLRAGELITHISGRRVRGKSDVLQRLREEVAPLGSICRVLGADGPRDAGPVFLRQIREMTDYVEPRGAVIAEALRDYRDGYAERAYERLAPIRESAPETELPGTLMARIAYTAGHGAEALALLRRYLDPSSLGGCATGDWTTLSTLDEAGPQRAPFALEWALCEEGRPNYERNSDPDLRVQRILVPARRWLDAHLKAAELWWHRRDTNDERIAGNLLAVNGWMLYELELRSECCRLIEPRSALLRRSPVGAHKWVRVDTDAWLPFFAGDAAGALEAFYDDALEVLNHPPRPNDPNSLVRNPAVAARVSFFLYQFPEDKRLDETLRLLSDPPHPVLAEYLRWTLRALYSANAAVIRRHLAAVLPVLPESAAPEFGRALALLEYVQAEPAPAVLAAARQAVFQSPAGEQRGLWLAEIDALAHLSAGRAAAALEALQGVASDPDSAALRSTAQFLSSPPPRAAEHAVLRNPLLVVPLGTDEQQWIVLARDRRLMRFDGQSGQLQAMAAPSERWYPAPHNWPWLGREPASGRVWTYGLRRVYELAQPGQSALALNIRSEEIDAFHRYVGPHFTQLAEAIGSDVRQIGEDGEFARGEVTAHAEYTTDPALPEIALISALQADPRVVQVAIRGGPHLLLDRTSARSWSSHAIAQAAGLPRPPTFLAQALWPADSAASPVVLLFSEQGLLRFDLAAESVERLTLPGQDAATALVPEDAPYARRDPRYVYFAGLGEAPIRDPRGPSYRLRVEDGALELLDTQNIALPAAYYRLLSRSALRAQLSARMRDLGLPDLNGFLQEVQKLTQPAAGESRP